MSATDYKAFVATLKKELPGEPILIVRFGDHQPSFAKHMVDPALTTPCWRGASPRPIRGSLRPTTPSRA